MEKYHFSRNISVFCCGSLTVTFSRVCTCVWMFITLDSLVCVGGDRSLIQLILNLYRSRDSTCPNGSEKTTMLCFADLVDRISPFFVVCEKVLIPFHVVLPFCFACRLVKGKGGWELEEHLILPISD